MDACNEPNGRKDEKDMHAMRVYVLGEGGQPVLQFTSSSPTRNGTATWEEVQSQSHSPVPEPVEKRTKSDPKLRHRVNRHDNVVPKDLSQQTPQKVHVPKGAKEMLFDVKEVDGFLVREPVKQGRGASTSLSCKELPCACVGSVEPPPGLSAHCLTQTTEPSKEETAEALSSPPGLGPQTAVAHPAPPPGLCPQSAEAVADPGPPPGLSQSFQHSSVDDLRGLCTSMVDPSTPMLYPTASPSYPPRLDLPPQIEGTTLEVQALLQSISLELTRVASNLAGDSCNPHFPNQSSESESSPQASDQVASTPGAENASFDGTWVDFPAESSAMWESLNMPSWDEQYSQYTAAFVRGRNPILYPASVPCDDSLTNMAEYTKPHVDFSAMLNGLPMM